MARRARAAALRAQADAIEEGSSWDLTAPPAVVDAADAPQDDGPPTGDGAHPSLWFTVSGAASEQERRELEVEGLRQQLEAQAAIDEQDRLVRGQLLTDAADELERQHAMVEERRQQVDLEGVRAAQRARDAADAQARVLAEASAAAEAAERDRVVLANEAARLQQEAVALEEARRRSDQESALRVEALGRERHAALQALEQERSRAACAHAAELDALRQETARAREEELRLRQEAARAREADERRLAQEAARALEERTADARRAAEREASAVVEDAIANMKKQMNDERRLHAAELGGVRAELARLRLSRAGDPPPGLDGSVRPPDASGGRRDEAGRHQPGAGVGGLLTPMSAHSPFPPRQPMFRHTARVSDAQSKRSG